MSWLSPGRWLLYGALIAALVLGYFAWAKHQQGIGYDKAKAEYKQQADAADAKRAAIAVPVAAKQEAAQVRIRTITKTILKEVPIYVKADSCPLPGGYRVLVDAAADGVIPDPSRIPDAAPVSAQDAAETTVSNYGTYHETAERLIGLQSWVAAQQALKK